MTAHIITIKLNSVMFCSRESISGIHDILWELKCYYYWSVHTCFNDLFKRSKYKEQNNISFCHFVRTTCKNHYVEVLLSWNIEPVEPLWWHADSVRISIVHNKFVDTIVCIMHKRLNMKRFIDRKVWTFGLWWYRLYW